jgi:hypothetical protein
MFALQACHSRCIQSLKAALKPFKSNEATFHLVRFALLLSATHAFDSVRRCLNDCVVYSKWFFD